MRKEIKKAFYDKKIHILNTNTTIDAEGGVTVKGNDIIGEFNGNVNVTNCEKLQEEYGLDYKVNISVTTDYTGLMITDLIEYQGSVYEVKGIYNLDSHILVLGVTWRQ